MKTAKLTDFLTEDQIVEVAALWRTSPMPAKSICEKVILPNIAEINRRLGQENDPMYLAYACEAACNEAHKHDAMAGVSQYIKEAVAAGGVSWKCPAGHIGLFRPEHSTAKRLTAEGKAGLVYEMPKDDCPGCGE